LVDRRKIVQQWREGNASVLVTLVRAEGSSYRRPGAHLLIGDAGEHAGTISGGCLEAELIRKAEWMVRDGALVRQYSTLFDDTAEMPFGLGCGGIVDLLVEPVATPEATAFLLAMERSLAGEESLVTTLLPTPTRRLERTVTDAAGRTIFTGNPGPSRQPAAESYLERLLPPQRLFVLGAGDDARPLVTMAALLGWNVVVVDGRAHLARRDRFPEAERVIAGALPLDLRSGDAAVVMTHSFEQDRAMLTSILGTEDGPGYVGVLGARHRGSLLVGEVAAALGRTVAECCSRMYAPVGLDLGGDGPEAIALAVIAEVQAWVQGRLGTSRRLTAADVADQIARGGSSHYAEVRCATGTA
jgi:xanthine dehydrogenase accessory factor